MNLRIAGISILMMLSSCHTDKGGHSHGKHQHLTEKSTMKIEKPRRISHSYEQVINGSVKEIMPLYCPVRELDWCENWAPKAVYSNTSVVEKDCIFITSHGEDDVVWIVTEHNVEKGYVEMYYHVPKVLVTKLEIQVTPIAEGKTKAVLVYTKTSLSEKGDEVLEGFTKGEYDVMMNSWEKAMNHYLATGEMLTGLPNF